MGNVFDFRSGRSIKGCNPQQVGEELERIRAERGVLLAADVLEEAANPDSPLHPAFEWNDGLAAKQHRLNQARRLIVSIRVLNSPAGPIVPAFISVKTPGEGRNYVPTVQALTDEELRFRVIAEARQLIEGLERRYAHLAAAQDVLSRLKQAAG